MNKRLAIYLLVFQSAGSFAGDADKTLTVDDVASIYAECTAYYTMVVHALNASSEPESAQQYKEVEETAMLYSLLLASETREQDVAIEVTNARIEAYMKQMNREVHGDNANIAILINKYSFDCQDAIENPSPYVSEALERAMAE